MFRDESALLDSLFDSFGSGATIIAENNDSSSINWARGLSDPGEMIACGAFQELRRNSGESDDAYQARLLTLDAPAILGTERMKTLVDSAVSRASLDTSNGRVAFMGTRKAWHGLGVQIDRACTSAEAIKFAGLDWQVVKVPMSWEFNGIRAESNDTYAIVRADTGRKLGTVGSRYAPIQNADGFEFLDSVLGEFGAKYETAGAIHGGKQIFLSVNLPNSSFAVNGTDTVESYAVFCNPHDGISGTAKCFPTSIRTECANTYRVAQRDAKKGIGIRHTGSVRNKIADARVALGIAVKGFDEFKSAAEEMARKPLEIRHYANDVLDAVLDVTAAESLKGADLLAACLDVTDANRELARKAIDQKIKRRGEVLEDILERYESKLCGNNDMRGTAWSAFNAVTEHADYNRLGRKVGNSEERSSRRFESMLSGSADEMKQAAYQLAMV